MSQKNCDIKNCIFESILFQHVVFSVEWYYLVIRTNRIWGQIYRINLLERQRITNQNKEIDFLNKIE